MDSKWTLISVLNLSLAGIEEDKVRYIGKEKNSAAASLKKIGKTGTSR